MGSEIDRLEIMIETEASAANRELTKLERNLGKIAAQISSIGEGNKIRDISADLDAFSNSLKGLSGFKTTDFNRIDKGLRKITGMSFGGMDKGTANIKSLANAFTELSKNAPKVQINTEKVSAAKFDVEKFNKALESVGKNFSFTGTAKEIQSEVDKLMIRLDSLLEREDKMVTTGTDKRTKPYRNLQFDIARCCNQLDVLLAKQEQLSSPKDFWETPGWAENLRKYGTTDLSAIPKKIDANGSLPQSVTYTSDAPKFNSSAMQAVFGDEAAKNIKSWDDALQIFGKKAATALHEFPSEELNQKIKSISTSLQNIDDFPSARLNQSIASTSSCLQNMKTLIKKSMTLGNIKKTISVLGSFSKKVFFKIGSSACNIASKISGAFTTAFGKIRSGLNRLVQHFHKSGRSMNNSMSLARMVGMSVLFSTVFRAITAVTAGFTEGIQNLARCSDSTNASLSLLMSSMTQLKNAVAAAFAPLLDVAAPILNAFMQKVISAANSISAFIGALTGKTTFIRAKKVNQDYAASLDDTSGGLQDNADSADNANKANKELQKTLLGFDQINALSNLSDLNSGSGNGAGNNSSGESAELSPSDMFETVNIGSGILDLADKIKDAWSKADFTEIGAMLGNKLNTALENIKWDKIKATTSKIAKSLATFLNGFIETTNWGLVGETISEGLNTAFTFVDTFARNFYWGSLGKAIGNGIDGALRKLDWKTIHSACTGIASGIAETLNNAIATTNFGLVGKTIAKGFNTAFDTVYGFASKFNWKKLGQGVADGINKFFKTLNAEKLADGINSLVNGFCELLGTTLKEVKWGDVFGKMLDVWNRLDWKVKLGTVALTIGKGLFSALALVFSKAELSGLVATSLGGSLLTGLGAAIGGVCYSFNMYDAFSKLRESIKDKDLFGIISSAAGVFTLPGSVSLMTEQAQGFLDKIGFKNLIVEKFSDAGSWLLETGKNLLYGLGEGVVQGWVTVGITFINLKNKILETLGDAKQWLVGKGQDAIEGLRIGWESVKENKLLSLVGGLGGEVFSRIGDIGSTVMDKGRDIIAGLKQGYENNKESGLLDHVGKLGTNVFRSIGNINGKVYSKGWDIVKGIKSGLTDNFSHITDWVANIPEKIANAIGSLEGIGQDLIQGFVNGFKSISIPTPHFDIGWSDWNIAGAIFSVPQFNGINWYAKGGIFDKKSIIGVGEDGKEAVMPLEKNTGWIDILSQKIYRNMSGMELNTGELFLARERGINSMCTVPSRSNFETGNIAKSIDEKISGIVESAIVNALMSVNVGSNQNKQPPVVEVTITADKETLYRIVREGKLKRDGRFSVIAGT